MTLDHRVRIAAFNWLSEQVSIHGDVLPRKLFENGFLFNNERVPLIAPQGIFKPRILELPLTITTAPQGPYDDSFDANGVLLYKYRGTDPKHGDNIGLRKAMQARIPLIYLHGVVPGKYLAVWPVYIIHDDPDNLTFRVVADDSTTVSTEAQLESSVLENAEARRAYITSTVKIRLHQRGFREKVLNAYRTQCSLCRLRHEELLDAAHIIPDNEPDSTPTVDNGIALCKLHHAAFDSFMIGITPDYQIKIRYDILNEEDGPMLQHGLKGLESKRIILPSSKRLWPKQDFLDRRYQKFMRS
jgi:putative restriction endonuclease